MTVRWKPLIVLTGLFLVVAAMGLMAFFFALPGKADDVLLKARADAKAGRFPNAEIHYRRALQFDARSVAIHEEFSEFYGRWMAEQPPKDAVERDKLHSKYAHALADAAKYGKSRPGPRRKLLADALSRDDAGEALPWADELIALDPKDPSANYVKAIEALDRRPADIASVKERLAVLTATEPNRLRTLWVRARLARETGDQDALARALDAARSAPVEPATPPSERLARLRLRLIDIERTDDPKALAEHARAFASEAGSLAAEPEPAPARIRLLGDCLEAVQQKVSAAASRDATAKADLTALADSLEAVAELIHKRAREGAGNADMRVHLAYVEHLMSRQKHAEAIKVAEEALKLPIAANSAWEGTVAGLREAAAKAALAEEKDPARYEKAEPFIKDLLASTNPKYAGIGHFFRGLIALDRSNLTAGAGLDGAASSVDPKLRDEAVSELRKAAEALPEAATAQALYGVVLVLTNETTLGRQHLQAAYRLGGPDRPLEPKYQVWAALSILQAGYPEEAEPILERLQAAVDRGDLKRGDLEPMLHLLRGEAHQARGTDEQLKLAAAEFQKAIESGQPATTALQIRMAQIDLRLGNKKAGLDRLEGLRKSDPKAGASAERLAVLALQEAKKPADAAKRLAEARTRYPESDELAELDAALKQAAGDAAGAEKVLADYTAEHPNNVALAMARARVLAGPLKKPEEARAILAKLAEKADNSAPLVQLALLDLGQKNLDGAARTIAAIRARWKEAAAADLLDAQLSIASDNPRAAAAHLEVALQKDPNNKVALFWKALLDERTGAKAKASQALETLLRDKPVKEVEDGLSLGKAAEWALADMALQNQDLDAAIKRFEGLVQASPGGELDRAARWKLIVARAGKGDQARAKEEVKELLKSPATTPAERVQAADFYRRQGDDAACLEQLDLVLKKDPTDTGALSYKALAVASRGRPEEAVASLRAALKAGKDQPDTVYLLLAAAENIAKPKEDASQRALAALEEGRAKYPKSVPLVQATYQVKKLLKDPKALAFVEQAAQAEPSPAMKAVLIDAYREEAAYDKAEEVARALAKDAPKDPRLAAQLVGLVALRAADAAEKGDAASARKFESEATNLIRKYRADFPQDVNFPQAEWDLAFRRGDLAKARALCDEIAAMDPASPTGPLLRARLHALEGRTEQVARAYDEALARSPGRADIRLALAQADLAMGKPDEALKQTKFVLDSERDEPRALLLRAQALVSQDGTPAQKAERRTEAATSVRDAIKVNPSFLEAYHLLAELRLLQGERAMALNALRQGLKVNGNDDSGLSSLVYHLCEPKGPNAPADVKDVQEAMALAEEFAARDDRGVFSLAVAIGFSRAGRNDLALPWAEKAAKKIDRPAVHMTYGGILLARAEGTSAVAESRELFQKAIEQYDAVLKEQPGAMEAVNNKAWILHRYLNRNPEALALAESFAKKADPASLPPEFYDTLGAIQEAANQPRKAEESYTLGLKRAPEHPTLNFRLGKLLAPDRSRAPRAQACLEAARARRDRLAPDMARELDGLIQGLSH